MDWSSIDNLLQLSTPVGWDELGVIATVTAVFVALRANRGARKQLSSALKMQEQSKNVALLEQRVRIAEAIQNDELPSMLEIKVLFNEEICKCYEDLCKGHEDYQFAQNDEKTYFEAKEAEHSFHPDSVNVKSEIEQYEYYMERPDCPPNIYEEYRLFCNANEAWWSETGLNDDRKMYNHADIRDRMITAYEASQTAKKSVLDLIEKYISNSIAPVK